MYFSFIRLLSLVTLICSHQAFADQPYSGEVFLQDQGHNITVTHLHSRESKPKGLLNWYTKAVTNLHECDLNNPNQGVLQIFRNHKRIYCTATPALTHLWLSSDEEYVVGLSYIQARNSHQLVVYSVDGELIYRTRITCDVLDSYCAETNSEYIYWFHLEHPAILLEQQDNSVIKLVLQDKYKQSFSLSFKKKPEKPLDSNACGRNRDPYHIQEFWTYYIQGLMHVQEKYADIVCVYYQRDNTGIRSHYYLSRQDYDNRNIKQNSYRSFLAFNYTHMKRYPKYVEEYFSKDASDIRRITGLTFRHAEDWFYWWEEYRDSLVLSEDGERLVVKKPEI